MHIPSHQIHNVLKAYKRLIARKKGGNGEAHAVPSISYASKQRAVIEKIIRDISGRIMVPKTKSKPAQRPSPAGDETKAYPFVYNVVTADSRKETRQIAVEAADFLIKSLERLAEEDQAGPEGENA